MALAVGLLALIFLAPAYADQAVLYEYDGTFEDATFDTKDAIIG